MNIVDCGHDADEQKSEHTTGYGEYKGKRLCFHCCGERDREDMIKTGKATLYLTHRAFPKDPEYRRMFPTSSTFTSGKVTNWPGTLSFSGNVRRGRHNIARTRYDIWFDGPDGYRWHGVQYGEWTQICHVKRTKHQIVEVTKGAN